MSDEFFDFGIGEGDDKVGQKITRFSAEKRTYRLGFADWAALDEKDMDKCLAAMLEAMTAEDEMNPPTPRFTGAPRHYMKGVGYFLHKGPEYAEIAGGAPKTYVGTIIIEWNSDAEGNVTKDSLKRLPLLHPWIVPKDKYQTIAASHRQFPFGEHDLMVTCTDPSFQKMTFLPARSSLFRTMLERALGKGKAEGKPDARAREICVHIIETARTIRMQLRGFIARDMSLKEIREKLGGAEESPVAGGVPAADGQVDDILDDILED